MKWVPLGQWPLWAQFSLAISVATVVLVLWVGEMAAERDDRYLREKIEDQKNQLLDNLTVIASDAIAAEDVSLLRHLANEIGESDSSIHSLEVLNAQKRLLVRWIRPVAPGSELLILKERTVLLDGVRRGFINAIVDLTPAVMEVSARAHDTRIAMAFVLLLVALTVVGMIYNLAILPLGELDKRLSLLRKGEIRADLELKGAAEFQHIAVALNGFANQILERQTIDLQHREELSRLNSSYLRFVPKQFLEFLNHKSIIEVQHGEQVERNMTVLFSDIRSFTSISEKLGAQQTFKFLNDFLSRVGPVVSENGGFIDKYIGDAIMALFESPVDALNAGMGMERALHALNQERALEGRAEIKIGIGINTGDLMLGIVGESSRMEGTVIGDAVNLASRLESLTKKYNTPFLISENTLAAIRADLGEEAFLEVENRVRLVDLVQAKGRQGKTRVYEVLTEN